MTELNAIGTPPNVIAIRPAAVDSYLRDLERLDEAINADLAAGDDSANRTIRALIDTVTVMPTPAGAAPGIVVRGELGSLLDLGPFQNGPLHRGAAGAG